MNNKNKISSYINSYIKKKKKWINETPKRKTVFKDIKNISLILISTFVVLVLWSNRINIAPENVYLWIQENIKSFGITSRFPVKIQGEKIQTENLQINDKRLVALSDSSFDVFSKNGKELQNEKHSFSNPNLQYSGLRYMLFDRGGTSFKIASDCGTLHCGTTEQKILTATVASDGSYAIATQSPRYLSELQVFNKHNVLKFKIPFSEYYITNVDINPYCEEIIVSGISSHGGDIVSNIYVIDPASQSIKSQFGLEDNMVTDLKYFSNGNFVAIGDKYCAFINPKTKLVTKKDYENNILKFYDFDKSGVLCLCLSSSENECSKDIILKLDGSGKEIKLIKTNYSFNDIILKGSSVIGVTNDKIISYNMWGGFDGYIKLEKHYRKILPAPHGYVYALNSCNVSKIKLSGFKRD